VHTIHVVGGQEGGSDLPFIMAPLTIDGFKQHDSQPNTVAHRLSGLPVRKKLDETLRQSFLAPADPLRADTKTLRKTVQCPGDATGGCADGSRRLRAVDHHVRRRRASLMLDAPQSKEVSTCLEPGDDSLLRSEPAPW
jgi:hypothetical protein